MSIWVCGEALMDVLPHGAVVGGGAANTARALARLGHDVEFIGGISSDEFGRQVRAVLLRDDVGLRHSVNGEMPTSTATVVLDKSGGASYVFSTDATATFDFHHSWLPDPSRFKPSILHVGTLATAIEPGASILLEWAHTVAEFAPIIFDPNVRPAIVKDRESYVESVEKWIELSSVVKVSEDDLAWLYPNENPIDVGRRWIENGVPLVVITRGSSGLMGIVSDGIVEVPGAEVVVVDTVGAGDTVGAIIVEAVLEFGVLNLHGEVLREVLNCAAVAAGITCSRAGAEPPARFELAAALKSTSNH
jgi:fructokinase